MNVVIYIYSGFKIKEKTGIFGIADYLSDYFKALSPKKSRILVDFH